MVSDNANGYLNLLSARMLMFRFLIPAFAALISGTAFAQTSGHVAEVREAQRAAYAMRDSTNGCPVVGSDMFGWPGNMIRKCVYDEGTKPNQLTGLVYLLNVKPEAIAQWIETACAEQMPEVGSCFRTVLVCGKKNSGMMFAISGNVMENMNPTTWKNYFFRNGMTVSIGGEKNGSTTQVPLERQEALALMPNAEISAIPSGMTRFWRTLPSEFAARYPNEGVPSALNSTAARDKWLDVARSEFLGALTRRRNRLLEAWMAAHIRTLSKGKCSEDDDS